MEDKQYKKFYRKADKHLNGKVEAEHGKRNNHKMKPYFVLQYLLKNSDENHTKSAYDIMYVRLCKNSVFSFKGINKNFNHKFLSCFFA